MPKDYRRNRPETDDTVDARTRDRNGLTTRSVHEKEQKPLQWYCYGLTDDVTLTEAERTGLLRMGEV